MPNSQDHSLQILGRRYEKYLVRGRLSEGQTSEVLLVDAFLGDEPLRQFALKMLHEGADEQRFIEEADLMNLLEHPNLVQLVEHGSFQNRPFVVMEYLARGDLRAALQRSRRLGWATPPSRTIHIAIDVLRALSYLHAAASLSDEPLQLVHGGVCPSNILIASTGELKLCDYGSVSSRRLSLESTKALERDRRPYLSPERAQGLPPQPSDDLWAVAILLHELSCGTHPLGYDESDDDDLRLLAAGKVSLDSQLPRELRAILERALAPTLRARFPTAGAFAGELFGYSLDQGYSQNPAGMARWHDRLRAGTRGLTEAQKTAQSTSFEVAEDVRAESHQP